VKNSRPRQNYLAADFTKSQGGFFRRTMQTIPSSFGASCVWEWEQLHNWSHTSPALYNYLQNEHPLFTSTSQLPTEWTPLFTGTVTTTYRMNTPSSHPAERSRSIVYPLWKPCTERLPMRRFCKSSPLSWYTYKDHYSTYPIDTTQVLEPEFLVSVVERKHCVPMVNTRGLQQNKNKNITPW